jgi:hypothetical protein
MGENTALADVIFRFAYGPLFTKYKDFQHGAVNVSVKAVSKRLTLYDTSASSQSFVECDTC